MRRRGFRKSVLRPCQAALALPERGGSFGAQDDASGIQPSSPSGTTGSDGRPSGPLTRSQTGSYPTMLREQSNREIIRITGSTMDGIREARLRPEYARLYPEVPPGWQPAAQIAEQVAERLIAQRGYVGLRGRVLRTEHFEYRGQLPAHIEPRGQFRRLADRMS